LYPVLETLIGRPPFKLSMKFFKKGAADEPMEFNTADLISVVVSSPPDFNQVKRASESLSEKGGEYGS
jgi:hypothetical protein